MKLALTLSIVIACAGLGYALLQSTRLAAVQIQLKAAEVDRDLAIKSSTDFFLKLRQAELNLANEEAILKETRKQALDAVGRVGSAAREAFDAQKAEIATLKEKLARPQITR